jgi:hypothetical protein
MREIVISRVCTTTVLSVPCNFCPMRRIVRDWRSGATYRKALLGRGPFQSRMSAAVAV